MTPLDEQLEAARQEYQATRYPHDLADELGLTGARRWPWVAGLAAAAAVLIAALVWWGGDPIQSPQSQPMLTEQALPARSLPRWDTPRVPMALPRGVLAGAAAPRVRLPSTSKLPSLRLDLHPSQPTPTPKEPESWNASYANLGCSWPSSRSC